MWKRILLLMVVLGGAPATFAASPVILVLGDSLSAGLGIDVRVGWVALLQQRLAQAGYAYTVVNASISGDTTSGGRARLPQALTSHRPQWVILELGANDGLRGLPVKDMRVNLRAMIQDARAHGARVLLVGMRLPVNYGPAYTEQFHAVYVDLARREKIPLVPFLLDGVALRPDLLQDDGLHPRAQAQAALLDNVWPHLQPLLDKPTGRSAPAAGTSP
jgi:acyl-CoA thioesterase-1